MLIVRCIKTIEDMKMETVDQQAGVEIVRKALRAPCSTIAKNAGKDPSIVVEKVLAADTVSIGYDALKDQYVDVIQEGENLKITIHLCCVVLLFFIFLFFLNLNDCLLVLQV